MKDLMECCDLCTLITHDQYGGESAECTDDNCTCHKIGTVKDFSPTPTDSWEKAERLDMECVHGNYIGWCDVCPKKHQEYVMSFISQVRQKAKEEVLRDIIVMETPTRGIEGETVMEYASSLGIDLSDNK